MKNAKYILLTLLLACVQVVAAQPIFNYSDITICEGDSYDLLAYQTNEAFLPVGWEWVDWQGVSGTSVKPTVSPTVYTLEYRQTSNPSKIYTQNLTVSLRPKPTVSISPNGKQEICVGQPIHIDKVSAANYDDLYWIYVQTGQKYTTEDINDIAVHGNIDNKQTYKLVATNNECAVVAQEEMEYSVTKDDEYPIYRFLLGNNSGIHWRPNQSYCGDISVKEWLTPTAIVVPTGTTGDMAYDPLNPHSETFPAHLSSQMLYINPTQYESGENDVVKLLRYDIIWDREDEYTAGKMLSGTNYTNSYTLEVELYFKGCGTTKTYTSRNTVNIYHGCPTVADLNFNYTCDRATGKGRFAIWEPSSNPADIEIIDITFENLTLPGKYIPVLDTGWPSRTQKDFYTTFDEDAPSTMSYKVVVNYEKDGNPHTVQFNPTNLYICKKDRVINYRFTVYSTSGGTLNTSLIDHSLNTLHTNVTGANWTGRTYPTDTIQTTICLGSSVDVNIGSNENDTVQNFVWKHSLRPQMVVNRTNGSSITDASDGIPFLDYEMEHTDEGWEIQAKPSMTSFLFRLAPTETTTYLGTLNGLDFAFKVNVVNNRISAIDTAICRGTSIDLKTLERDVNINGTVSWNVTNTLVTPMVDTKYAVYGIAKNICPEQSDYMITDEVTVFVDENIWADAGSKIASCAGDWIDLNDALNTNARNFQWFDEHGNELPDGIVQVKNDTYYTVKMTNGCGTKTETVDVKVTSECLTYDFAKPDTTVNEYCFGSLSTNFINASPIDMSDFPCENPLVTIITPPSRENITATYNTSIKGFTYAFTQVDLTPYILDSIQYEVSCPFKTSTAWAYIEIKEPATKPEISHTEATESGIKIEVAGGNYDKSFFLLAVNANDIVSYEHYNHSPGDPLDIVNDTLHWTFFDNGTPLPDGNYYFMYQDMATYCQTMDSIVVRSGAIIPPVCIAENDTIIQINCTSFSSTGTAFDVLSNDSTTFPSPTIRILNSSFASVPKVQLGKINIGYHSYSQPAIDSLQYEIASGGLTDTAWVYFIVKEEYPVITTFTTSEDEVFVEMDRTAGTIMAGSNIFYLYSEDLTTVDLRERTNDPFATFENLSLPDGKYYVDACLYGSCCATDSFVITGSPYLPPDKVTANNDTVTLTPCDDVKIFEILNNDVYSCATPVVSLVNATPAVFFELTPDNKIKYTPLINERVLGLTDSLQYSITCGTATDTAWIYVHYPTESWLDVQVDYNIECLSTDAVFEETISIKNPCDTTRSVFVYVGMDVSFAYVDLTSSSIVSSSGATLTNYMEYPGSIEDGIETYHLYEITMNPNSEVELKANYKVISINEGRGGIGIVNYIYPSMVIFKGGAIYGEDRVTDLYPCPDRNFTVKDCDVPQTFNLEQNTATAYRLTQPAQLSGASAAISASGLLTYTPVDVSAITYDSVKYEVDLNDGSTLSGTVSIAILPCIDAITTATTDNDHCNDDLCEYDGPSILINEVMIAPTNNNGAIYGQTCDGSAVGGEWVELYNPDNCNPVDISGYFFGNATTDNISTTCTVTGQNIVRNLGAAFVLPEGTVIPPNGFCVLRGERAAEVDSARLVENGGNVVVIDLVDHISRFCMNNGGKRFWLPDLGGWFGFYDRNGVPQDAIYWGDPTADICPDCNPCNPMITGTYQGQLASLDDFPTERKNRIGNINLTTHLGVSPKRQPGGGDWDYNVLSAPTQGACNGTCTVRQNSNCNGTATVTPQGGSGNFSYQWNDPAGQTTATAVGLCEGTYYCLVTDSDTKLTQIAGATVRNNPVFCSIDAVNDELTIHSCYNTYPLNILANDSYKCATPTVKLLDNSIFGANVSINAQNEIDYKPKFTHLSFEKTDSLRYSLACNGQTDTAWVFFHYPKSPIEVTENYNQTCYAAGDTIIADITVKNTCPLGTRRIMVGFMINDPRVNYTALDATVTAMSFSDGMQLGPRQLGSLMRGVLIDLHAGGTAVLRGRFVINYVMNVMPTSVTSIGYILDETTKDTLHLSGENMFSRCPDHDLVIEDCGKSMTLDLSQYKATAYNIISQQLAGSTVSLTTEGQFTYTPPKVTTEETDEIVYEITFDDGSTQQGTISIRVVSCYTVPPCTPPSLVISETETCQNGIIHLTFTGITPFDLDYTFNSTRQTIIVSGMDTTLVATQPGANDFIMYGLTSGDGCSTTDSGEKGVDINGVVWATRNVDMPGTFTATPEEAGMFYQWGKNVGWSTTDPMINSDGNTAWDWTVTPITENWKPENDPCPCGWRVPTKAEQWDMIGDGSIDIVQDGVLGRLSNTDLKAIFLPYATNSNGLISGWRNPDGSLQVFAAGDYSNGPHHSDYWAATGNEAWDLCFRLGYPIQELIDKQFCPLIRCVKDLSRNCPVSHTITVLPTPETQISDSICKGETYIFNGTPLATAGIYRDTLQVGLGCDSIVILNLSVFEKDTTYLSRIIHPGESYLFNHQTLTAAGEYRDTLINAGGCDSLIILDLKLCPLRLGSITTTLCKGETMEFAGKIIDKGGIYRDTTLRADGCDTITILTLTILPTSTTYLEAEITIGDSYYFAENYLTDSGIYRDTLEAQNLCDSIVILNLTVLDTLSSKIKPPEGFSPNGDGINDHFVIPNIENFPNNHILIFNRWGNKVYEGKPYMNEWDGRNHVGGNIGNNLLPVGTYFYILDLGDGSQAHKGFIYLTR